jgi:hypothetical protein
MNPETLTYVPLSVFADSAGPQISAGRLSSGLDTEKDEEASRKVNSCRVGTRRIQPMSGPGLSPAGPSGRGRRPATCWPTVCVNERRGRAIVSGMQDTAVRSIASNLTRSRDVAASEPRRPPRSLPMAMFPSGRGRRRPARHARAPRSSSQTTAANPGTTSRSDRGASAQSWDDYYPIAGIASCSDSHRVTAWCIEAPS